MQRETCIGAEPELGVRSQSKAVVGLKKKKNQDLLRFWKGGMKRNAARGLVRENGGPLDHGRMESWWKKKKSSSNSLDLSDSLL